MSLTDGIDVRTGKPLDVLALKGASLGEIRDYAAHLRRTAERLYRSGRPPVEVAACPCCEADAAESSAEAVVYDIPYHRCADCGHGFVRARPAPEELDAVFAESEELAAAYTDPTSVEVRLEQVVRPKLEWALGVYRGRYGRDPESAVDVGAGGGHFVAAARRAGIAAEGYELSKASRRFARETFGVELRADDFLAAEPEPAGLVTFFGLLEYTPQPLRFLEAARRRLDPRDGLLVVEVPRLDCLGTEVQKRFPETVARHLDPTSHVNCFSDDSLAAALERSGFRPAAAWYFGMDAYELAVQLGLLLGEEAFPQLAEALLPLQPALDAARLCDDLILAAVPA